MCYKWGVWDCRLVVGGWKVTVVVIRCDLRECLRNRKRVNRREREKRGFEW